MDSYLEGLQDSVTDMISDSSIAQPLLEAGEEVTDLFSDLLGALPVVRTLKGLYDAGVGVREFLFLRKLRRFLPVLKEIPTSEREAFSRKIHNNKKLRDRVGASLVMLLERLDDLDKPELVARAFQAFMRDEIDLDTFQKISAAIDRCFVADLAYLSSMTSPSSDLPAPTASSFYMAGLTQVEAIESEDGLWNSYRLSNFGKQFVEIVLT